MDIWIDWSFIRVSGFVLGIGILGFIIYTKVQVLKAMKVPVPYKHHRRIVCAAAKLDDAIIVSPRHFDPTMHEALRVRSFKYPHENWHNSIQGFVDQQGIFLTREEALVVAKAANQIVRRVGGDQFRLYSENMY